jgi:hypothetical protein
MDLVETKFDDITSPLIRTFDRYWRSKWRGHLLPGRNDIDPTEIKEILPHFILVDLEPEPFRVRYRLSGSAISEIDEEITGVYLDQTQNIDPAERLRIERRYRAVYDEKRPVFIRRKQISRRTSYELDLQAGIWPLSKDGVTVDQCAAVEDFPTIG